MTDFCGAAQRLALIKLNISWRNFYSSHVPNQEHQITKSITYSLLGKTNNWELQRNSLLPASKLHGRSEIFKHGDNLCRLTLHTIIVMTLTKTVLK